MALRRRLTEKAGRVFTKVSRRLENNILLELLKPSETDDEFQSLLRLDSKWFFEYSDFRKNFLLEIGEDSLELREKIAEATHVLINEVVYVIRDGDTTPPLATDFTWKIYCDRDERTGQHYKVLGT